MPHDGDMSSLRRRFSRGLPAQAGTSVLAALVMVAILSVAGYAFEQVRNQYIENTQQLAAAASANSVVSNDFNDLSAGSGNSGTGYVNIAPSSGFSNSSASTQDKSRNNLAQECAQAIQACTANPGSCAQSKTSQAPKPTEGANDSCVAAVPSGQSYKCVGKSVTVTINTSSNDITILDSRPNPNEAPGMCATLACTPNSYNSLSGGSLNWNRNCIAISNLQGVSKTSVGASYSSAPSDQIFGLSKNGGFITNANDSSLATLSNMFGTQVSNGASLPQDQNGNTQLPAADQIAKFAEQNPNAAAQQASQDVTAAAIQLNPDITGSVDGPPAIGSPVESCAKGSCDYMLNANDIAQIQYYKDSGYDCADPINGAVVCSSTSGTGSNVQPPPNNPPLRRPPGNNTTLGGGQQRVVGGNSGLFGGISSRGATSFLTGLLRGIAQSVASTPQQMACTSDQNAYNQQLQQYQYQQQQYQYQMQLYQQQEQLARFNGNYVAPLPPTPPAQPCYNRNAASQCTSQQPPQPDASQCSVGSWKPLYSGSCIANWQCVPTSGNGQKPTAQLSCNPQVADVGTPLAIAYSCSNATQSQGSGFDTGGQVSGTTTTTIAAPPQGANTATYGLTCANGALTSSAQCSVQISNPSIVLVANPQTVKSGDTTSIGWVTSGMQACTISSPEQPSFSANNVNNTSVNSMASSSPITEQTDFVLDCETLGGGERTATTTVTYPGAPLPDPSAQSAVTVSSDADGATVNHGDSVNISWQVDAPPADTAVSLWLYPCAQRQHGRIGLRRAEGEWQLHVADPVDERYLR